MSQLVSIHEFKKYTQMQTYKLKTPHILQSMIFLIFAQDGNNVIKLKDTKLHSLNETFHLLDTIRSELSTVDSSSNPGF